MEPRFDVEQVFDEDYLYFYEPLLTDEVSDRHTDTIWRLLELAPGMEVLDLACGHGRISNRFAERGCRVTGLDATPLFLARARRDAAERGVDVDYVEGDMRKLPWADRFDAVVCWFTSFGYFDDDENRRVLAEARRALRPGGGLAIENNNVPWILRNYRPEVVSEREGNYMIDLNEYQPVTGRNVTERVIVRGGNVRSTRFFVRMLAFTELRDWLLAAGFTEVQGYGRDGEALSFESPRMVTVARR